MKQLTIALLVLACIPINVMAWFGTDVDTVEVRYASGNLKEQYQTVHWHAAETTNKYGFYRSWHENGQREWDGHYAGRVGKHGTWIMWDSSGSRVEEISYLQGKKHGAEIEWNPSGTLKTILHYRDGEMHGLCVWRKANYGVTSVANSSYMTFVKQEFYLDGTLVVSPQYEGQEGSSRECCNVASPYYNADLDLWIEWKPEECAFFVGRKVDDKKHGEWVLWSKDGDMIKTERYDMGALLE